MPNHPIALLAWEAIRAYIERGEVIRPPTEVPPELARPGGIFVCIKKDGKLRGCIGTIEADLPTRAEEAIRNAIHAATMDPRFAPVEASELEALDVSVHLLKPPEPVTDLASLEPGRFGIIASSAGRRSVVLPDIEGVDTVEGQLVLARQKLGIGPDDPVALERFETERFR
ncbi:MAG: AmmeMemoRadiSam system protein A [Nitrospinota bacterium]